MTRPRVPSWLVALGLGLACAASALLQNHFDFEHDDAYISYRYAANWAQGHGPVFNPGERVEGYSDFLWVAVLRVCHSLGLDLVQSARMLGTLACFGLILMAFRCLSRGLQRGPGLALAASTALALHAAVAVWARSGLETVPIALAVLLAQSSFVQEHRRGAGHWRSGVQFGIVAMLRIDGFLFFVATFAFLVLRVRTLRRLGSLAAGFLVVFGPFFGWRYAYYGYLWPNSYYLKTGGDIYQQLRGLFYAYNFVEPFGGLLLFALPLLLLVFRDRERDATRAYLGFSVAFVTAYIVWVGGDHMPMSRFFVPLVAPITFLWLETTVELDARLGTAAGVSVWRRRLVPGVLLGSVVLAGFLPALNPRRLPTSYAIAHRTLTRQWALAGRWFAQNIDPNKVLATDPAGAVAYFSRLQVIDMLGINDLHIAHLVVPHMGHGSAGHEKRDFDYVLSRRPDLIFRGVTESPAAEATKTYADGSSYRMRSAPLGRGPVADEFGAVRQTDLFLWFEERQGVPAAVGGGD